MDDQVSITAGDTYLHDFFLEEEDGTPIPQPYEFSSTVRHPDGAVFSAVVPTVTVTDSNTGALRLQISAEDTSVLLDFAQEGRIRIRNATLGVTIYEYPFMVKK